MDGELNGSQAEIAVNMINNERFVLVTLLYNQDLGGFVDTDLPPKLICICGQMLSCMYSVWYNQYPCAGKGKSVGK